MARENEKVRRNTILQGFTKLIIGICGIAIFPSAILCALSPHIDPSEFVWAAFFGLGFWLIFFANIIILIILLLLKARRTLVIPILTLLISIPGFLNSYSFGESNESDAQLKIMTYNVCVFRDYKDDSKSVSDVKKSLINFIKEQDPDVICLQESGKWPKNTAQSFLKAIGYKYYSYNVNNGNSYFSKYKIEDVSVFKDESINRFADIKKININKDRSFYLVNCHFNSFGISKQEIEYINDANNIVKEAETHGKSVIYKLKSGFERRTKSTGLLLNNLPDDNLPLIICGDFNDTPLSYTYNQMSSTGLQDAFITNSHGIGKTYCGPLPLLRIDYFWYNDMIDVVDYKRIKKTTSDHYPLIMTFNLKEKSVEETE